ncbi:MAG: type II toxin-antitoxin system Phd/YefM family antitoxin [Steroidobacteraceae bacterium]|nr:type II toxin-antitoxin system Phd/YefM family antitoxin [Steroidobacteraceae bacterium]
MRWKRSRGEVDARAIAHSQTAGGAAVPVTFLGAEMGTAQFDWYGGKVRSAYGAGPDNWLFPPPSRLRKTRISCIMRIYQEIMIMRNVDAVTVSAAEFHRNIGKYQDIALTKPVAITKNGRERTVLLSAEEYSRLKRRDRRVLGAEELSKRQLEAIRAARVPAEFAGLDSELKD